MIKSELIAKLAAENPHLTRDATAQTLADFDGARLASPVGAENRGHLTGARRERPPVDGGDGSITASVPHREIVHLDDVVDRSGHDAGTERGRRIGTRGHPVEASADETSPARPRG